MEIKKKRGSYFIDHAYIRSNNPVSEYMFLVKSKHGGEYELAVSVTDVETDTPNFQIMPSRSLSAQECANDFATIHWEFLKECVLIMEQCMFYDSGKLAVEKSRKWNEHIAINERTGRNNHIKIFEFQLFGGILKWVAAESFWKAINWYMVEYEVFCMEDEIEEIVELPKEKWAEYFLHETDGREIPFDKVISRRRKFPQIIAGTEKGGKVESTPAVENVPLGKTAKEISLVK